jgi:hypothetical protein
MAAPISPVAPVTRTRTAVSPSALFHPPVKQQLATALLVPFGNGTPESGAASHPRAIVRDWHAPIAYNKPADCTLPNTAYIIHHHRIMVTLVVVAPVHPLPVMY